MPITAAMAAIVTLGLGLGLGILFLARYLGSDHAVLPVTTDWLSELSIERYLPMLRLLDARDFQFLRSQPGYTPQMASRFRRQRVQAFRAYLRLLVADFGRVDTALQVILAQSEGERPELASVLWERRLRFACGVMLVRCRLVLFGWGCPGMDAAGLIRLFDSMRQELHTLVPASSSVLA